MRPLDHQKPNPGLSSSIPLRIAGIQAHLWGQDSLLSPKLDVLSLSPEPGGWILVASSGNRDYWFETLLGTGSLGGVKSESKILQSFIYYYPANKSVKHDK